MVSYGRIKGLEAFSNFIEPSVVIFNEKFFKSVIELRSLISEFSGILSKRLPKTVLPAFRIEDAKDSLS